MTPGRSDARLQARCVRACLRRSFISRDLKFDQICDPRTSAFRRILREIVTVLLPWEHYPHIGDIGKNLIFRVIRGLPHRQSQRFNLAKSFGGRLLSLRSFWRVVRCRKRVRD